MKRIAPIFFLVLLLVGCRVGFDSFNDFGLTSFFHSAADAASIIDDPFLEGEWVESPDGKTRMTFDYEKHGRYSIAVVGGSRKSQNYTLTGTLFRLDGTLFLDLGYFPDADSDLPETAVMFWLPVHQFMRVSVEGDSLSCALLSGGYVSAYIEKHPNALEYAARGKSMLITAETPELQGFLRKALLDDDAFEKGARFKRMTAD